VLTWRDQAGLEAVGRVGVATADQLKDVASLNPQRIAKLEHSGYLRSRTDYVSDRGVLKTYELTPKGEKWLRDERGWSYVVRPHAANVQHDLKLGDIYRDLKPELRESWLGNREAMSYMGYGEVAGRDNAPDAVLIVPVAQAREDPELRECLWADAPIIQYGGEACVAIAVEAIGSSYSQDLISEKADFASTHFGGYLAR